MYKKMKWNVPLCFVMMIVLLCLGEGGSTPYNITMRVDPQQIVLGGGERTTRLHISCVQRDGGNITTIEFGKILRGDVTSKMAIVKPGYLMPSIADESLRRRMRASGLITEGGGNLNIDLYQLKCEDAAQYYCMSVFNDHDRRNFVSHEVTVRAHPEMPFMRVTPLGKPYQVGFDLNLKCSGRVGSDVSSIRRLWRWEWRHSDESSTWTMYPYQTNITQERPTTDPTSPCEFQSTSTLIHTITKMDEGRIIRCSVIDSKYSDQMTIHVDKESKGLARSHILIVVVSVGCGICILVIAFVLGVIIYRSVRNNRPHTQVVIIPKYPDHQKIQFANVSKQPHGLFMDNYITKREMMETDI